MTMDPEIHDAWLAWLLDDDSKQCRGTLRLDLPDGTHANCCWGGLLDILVERGELTREPFYANDGTTHGLYTIPATGQTMVHYPTFELLDMVGIDREACPISKDVRSRLAGMNDHGSNFLAIYSEIRGMNLV